MQEQQTTEAVLKAKDLYKEYQKKARALVGMGKKEFNEQCAKIVDLRGVPLHEAWLTAADRVFDGLLEQEAEQAEAKLAESEYKEDLERERQKKEQREKEGKELAEYANNLLKKANRKEQLQEKAKQRKGALGHFARNNWL